MPALGAILVAAALTLIDVKALGEIRRISRVEFLFAIIALMGPLSLGVLQGMDGAAFSVRLISSCRDGSRATLWRRAREAARVAIR